MRSGFFCLKTIIQMEEIIMSNRKTLDQRIGAALEEIKQKEARYKELLQQQKAADRKARNHRLCKRGGQIESLLPGLAKLTDEQFKNFVDRCLNTSYTKRILSELAPPEAEHPNDGNAATQPANTEVRSELAPALKSTTTAQNNGVIANSSPAQTTAQPGANSNGKPVEAARVAS